MSKQTVTAEPKAAETKEIIVELAEENIFNIQYGKVYLFTPKRNKKVEKFIGEPVQTPGPQITFSLWRNGTVIGSRNNVELKDYNIEEISREYAQKLSFEL